MQINQLAFQKLLNAKLKKAQAKNKAFSLRAFAKQLGVAPGPLSSILQGKRNVSEKMAVQLLDRLGISPLERATLIPGVTIASSAADEDVVKVSEDQMRLIADWQHYAILSLTLVKDFKNQSSWIANRLGISENQVKDAISRLLRLKMLTETKQGKLKPAQQKLKTSDGVPSEGLKKAHLQSLDLARSSILNDPLELRDFISMTLPTHPRQLALAKSLMRSAQKQITDLLMDTPDKTEVYRLSLSLFPLTKVQK